MTPQNFTDDQNPYEYEKPVSASKFRKYGSVATLGLLAIGSAFGGSALAATIMATEGQAATQTTNGATDTTTTDANPVDSLIAVVPVTDANGVVIDPLAPTNTSSNLGANTGSSTQAPTGSSTAPASPIIALPVLAVVDYGNVSSSTPYGSSSNGDSTSASSWGDDDDDDDEDDDSDDRDDHNDRDDHDGDDD